MTNVALERFGDEDTEDLAPDSVTIYEENTATGSLHLTIKQKLDSLVEKEVSSITSMSQLTFSFCEWKIC